MLALGCALCVARAQDYERIAPKLPPNAAAPTLPVPPPPVPEGASTAKLSVRLHALVFVSGADRVRPSGLADTTPPGIDASQIPILNQAAFKAELARFLGQTFSFADLEQIRLAANTWLRAHKRPFVDISIPPQNISNGVVQVVVTQYRVGSIKVAGAQYFSGDYIRDTSGIRPGQTLDVDDLHANMDRLNQNPFLTVDAVFSPGAETGLTDVTLNAVDRFPVRVYAGYDNLGIRSLDLNEYNVGVNWGNAFWLGHVLSYQFTRTFNGRFTSHSLSDVIPLPWHDKLLVFGSFERQTPNIASVFTEVGHSGQASLRYVHELPRASGFTESLQIGYDFKSTDNNLDFSGFNIFAVQAEVDQFPLIYDASLADRWGQTTIQNLFVFSPGRITGGNTTAALQKLVPGASADYVYDRFLVTRATTLPLKLTAITRATLQVANGNLPNSEQLGGGGVGSVRGYYTDTAVGSEGVLASQEIRFPVFSPSALAEVPFGDQLQFGAFFDYAHLTQVTAIADVPRSIELASTGLNAHYLMGRYFDVQFDLGWRLRATASQPHNGAFGQVAITVGY